ncbi:MAG: hypothetical protein HRU19_07735 [Pseudobacteriovorax sp.]|nr:hypothetical protein [Pseudobacteriovorax sp.]
MIKFSNEARDQALKMAQEDTEGNPFRLYIEGKGCDGFFYGIAFDQKREDDITIMTEPELIIDKDSAVFCKNITITWVDDDRGRGFLVNNHDEKKFRGKFYKRKVWQDYLTENKPN